MKGSTPCVTRSSTILSIRLQNSSFVNGFSWPRWKQMECNIVHFHCMCMKQGGREGGREKKIGRRRKREREREGGREGGRGDYNHEYIIPAWYLQILRFCSKCHGEALLTGVPPQFQHDPVCLLEIMLYDYSVNILKINNNDIIYHKDMQLTIVIFFGSAPLLKSSLTTSVWPLSLASIKGVLCV